MYSKCQLSLPNPIGDNCSPVEITQLSGIAPNEDFPIGITINVFELTTNTGTTQCSFTVTVSDNAPPTMICQDITLNLDDSGYGSISAADIDNGSSDACGIDNLDIDITDFDCSMIGDNTVTLVATDFYGNTNSCTANVYIDPLECPTCDDGVQNGQETGIDCGGPDCPDCVICTESYYYSGILLSGIYEANGRIRSDALVTASSEVSLFANEILLDTGFEVELGAEFSVEISPCYNNVNTNNSNSLQEVDTVQAEVFSINEKIIDFYYSIPSDDTIELRIRSARGEVDQLIIDQEKRKGTHNIEIDATGLASGVYFILLKTQFGQEVKQIILL